jgi:hypothetical protein
MTTTYSPSLKLSLIGDGDQSGIWGQTTNNNLGTLLEQAITGVTSVVMADAAYTLSSYNGVPDESRNAVIVVTGANNGVRDLIPPVVEKLYTIVNNTSGGYAIRVIGATGTGVNIPNGVAALVYCNGINFYSGLSGTSGDFTVNGTAYANSVSTTGTMAVGTNATVGGTLNVTGATTLTGAATAPTPSYPDNTTKIATTAYVTAAAGAATIPSGSVFLLYQASAPTGWTQVTALDDYALRITSSTGGTTGGTTAFSTVFSNQTPTITVGSTTLSSTQMPSHSHSLKYGDSGSPTPFNNAQSFGYTVDTGAGYMWSGTPQGSFAGLVDNTGGSGSHNHSGSSSVLTLNVRYANIIICSKN